ncbi:unnamed protein product [Anisakis simplex]|uniref:Protein FAR1-RELATED SEQUENCE n=1 Tax=Anisakis simplex TaxID=6269 RepID=A0A0M3K5E0_ANISI|nr:unnamed protein product [Anisakis simplex]
MLEDGTDEIFMTEEYNELTWKKKIIDPRVPESERNFGGKVISSLPKEIAQREHIKFSTMQHVDQPIIADQHNTNGNKQHHLLSANDDTSHDNNINNNEFYSNLMQAQDNPSADEYNFKSSEQLEFTKTEEFDGDFPEVGTMEIMRLDDSDSDPSKYSERGFTLMFYDRPSELETCLKCDFSSEAIPELSNVVVEERGHVYCADEADGNCDNKFVCDDEM